MDQKKTTRRLVSVPTFAEYIGVKPRTGWQYVYSRRVPVIRFAGAVRIDLDEVDRLIEAATVPALEQ